MMSNLKALAMGLYNLRQVMSPEDQTCQDLVDTSIMLAEASVHSDPQRNERLAEFYRITLNGS